MKFFLGENLSLINIDFGFRVLPAIGSPPSFHAQSGEEFLLLGKLFPHLGEIGGLTIGIFQDDPVFFRDQLCQEIFRAGMFEQSGDRQHADFDREVVEFVPADRLETVVPDGGVDGVL